MHRGFISIVIGSVVFARLLSAQPAVDPNELLAEARVFEEAGDIEQARRLYRRILENGPAADVAVGAYGGLALLEVSDGKLGEAADIVELLRAEYAMCAGTPATLDAIAERYEWTGHNEPARGLYQRIIDEFPTSEYAGKADIDVTKMDILILVDKRRFEQADERLEMFSERWAGHLDFVEALYGIGQRLEWKAEHGRAEDIYGRVRYDRGVGAIQL